MINNLKSNLKSSDLKSYPTLNVTLAITIIIMVAVHTPGIGNNMLTSVQILHQCVSNYYMPALPLIH